MSSMNPRLRGIGSPARLRGMSKPNDDTLIALPFGALHKWHGDLREAFAHIDEPDALRYLASAFGHLVSIESVMISLEHKDRPPQLLYQRGIAEQYRVSLLERYFSGGICSIRSAWPLNKGWRKGFITWKKLPRTTFSTVSTTRLTT